MRLRALVALAVRADALLVVSDFDGTLARIVERPDAVRPERHAASAVRALSRDVGVRVVVASGRRLEDLRAMTAGWPVQRYGEHGAASDDAPPPRAASCPEALLEHASAVVAAVAGAWVERKPNGLVVHLRGALPGAPAVASELARRLAEPARRAGLRVTLGRAVVELSSVHVDKGDVVRREHDRFPSLALVAGDDAPDEASFAAARRLGGLAVHVASSERPRPRVPVDACVAGPAAWVALLTRIARARRYFRSSRISSASPFSSPSL